MLEAIEESFTELNRWLTWAKTMPTLEDWIQKNRESVEKFRAGSVFTFRIFSKQENTFLGVIALRPDDSNVPSYELGYWLRSAYTGKGLMMEAITGIEDFARANLHANRIQSRTDEANVKSWRVLERLGYEQEGTLMKSARNTTGDLVNMRLYAKCFVGKD